MKRNVYYSSNLVSCDMPERHRTLYNVQFHIMPAINQTVTLVSHHTPSRHYTRSTVGTHLLQFHMICLEYITQIHKFSMVRVEEMAMLGGGGGDVE